MAEAMDAEWEQAGVESPPASGMPVKEQEVAARSRLHELARQLRGAHNRAALVEYLRLRRQWR